MTGVLRAVVIDSRSHIDGKTSHGCSARSNYPDPAAGRSLLRAALEFFDIHRRGPPGSGFRPPHSSEVEAVEVDGPEISGGEVVDERVHGVQVERGCYPVQHHANGSCNFVNSDVDDGRGENAARAGSAEGQFEVAGARVGAIKQESEGSTLTAAASTDALEHADHGADAVEIARGGMGMVAFPRHRSHRRRPGRVAELQPPSRPGPNKRITGSRVVFDAVKTSES
ncbi:hypothetical protein [Streptomyces anandii]|uniref:Uncharacterized protein n=1 Tax=Streptomyces anandii TaxID=285454 RepID=A0ABW6H5G9_9ACTN